LFLKEEYSLEKETIKEGKSFVKPNFLEIQTIGGASAWLLLVGSRGFIGGSFFGEHGEYQPT